MSKQPRVATDPDLLKPIIEAVIFASEEPLSVRALIRLLAGEKDAEEASMPIDFAEGGERGEDGGSRMEDSGESVEDGGWRIEDSGERMEDGGEEGAVGKEMAAGDDEEGEGAGSASGAVVDAGTPVAGMTLPVDGATSEGDDEEGAAGENDAPATVEIEDADGPALNERETFEGDGADLADAMERVEERVSARQFRPADGTLDQAYLRALIDELNDEYVQSGRAFRIVEVAGGFQFATIREYGEFVAMLSKDKARRKLSPAALETLAIIAYRQPVSKPEVEAIRGVNCDQVLLNLMEKNLVAITGRSEAVGRPLLYGTTEDFLRSFGLKGLGDLPKLREIEELMEEDAYSAERAEVITVDENTDVAELEAQIGAAGHAGGGDEEDGGARMEDSEDRGSRMEDSEGGEGERGATVPVAGQLEDGGSRMEDREDGGRSEVEDSEGGEWHGELGEEDEGESGEEGYRGATVLVAGPLDVEDEGGMGEEEREWDQEDGSGALAISLADLPEPASGSTDEAMAAIEGLGDRDDLAEDLEGGSDDTEDLPDAAPEDPGEGAGDGTVSGSDGEIAENADAG